MRLYFLFFSIIASFLANAQTDTLSELKIGEWQQYLPWQRARYVTGSDSKVYYATEWAVVEIDKDDRSPRFLSKVDGLSDVGMGVIRYNRTSDVLLLTYSNSNIDLWKPDGTVTNLPFIKKNIGISGDKSIYDVFFDGKFAYLSCGFGLVKLNLEKEEVEYTVFTGIPVKSFAIFQNQLYMGTTEGLYRLSGDYPNPADFEQWHLMGVADNFPGDYSVSPMAVFDGNLYLGMGKTLVQYNGTAIDTVREHPTYEVLYLTTEGEGLVIGWKEQFNGIVQYREKNGSQYDIHNACEASQPIYAVEEGAKKFWFADGGDEFRYFDQAANACDKFRYNSPFSFANTEISLGPDAVYVATPGPPSQLGPIYGRNGVYIYKDRQWTQFALSTYPALQDGDCYADMWKVAAHPTEEALFYTGSWVGGLIEKKGNDVKCYSQYNSTLQGAGASGAGRTAIGGMAFDKDNNLWISNYDAVAPIAVRKADGSFLHFSAAPTNNLLQVAVDQNGYKWFVVAFNGGVLVYDSGTDLTDPSDDRYRLINNSNSNLPSNTVGCLEVDLEGNVWVGTQQGVVSFECGSNVFDPACKGSRRIIEVDGFNGYLLETEDVRTIAVDGANRKWFGTTNGIFVQSANADQQVAQFTSTNSPLFDNVINDIAINPKNGEVWIGTEKGIQVLRTEATTGGRVNTLEPYAYPNPVRPGYDGPIAVYGLARDANVKIADAAGNLVYEGKALGGQAVWDGRDYTGKRAASGVYLIFATSSEDFEAPDAIVTKVVILK